MIDLDDIKPRLGLDLGELAGVHGETLERVRGRVWLGDALGSLLYTGACQKCGRQFMTRNVYVWRSSVGLLCDACGKESHDH